MRYSTLSNVIPQPSLEDGDAAAAFACEANAALMLVDAPPARRSVEPAAKPVAWDDDEEDDDEDFLDDDDEDLDLGDEEDDDFLDDDDDEDVDEEEGFDEEE